MVVTPLLNAHNIGEALKVLLVLRSLQPGLLADLLALASALVFGTVTLPTPIPVIRNKKSLVVKAFTAPFRSLHRFKN